MNDLEAYKQALHDQIAELGAEPSHPGIEYNKGWDAALNRLAISMDVYKSEPKADFAGFKASELEQYLKDEVLNDENDVSWGYDLREALEEGIRSYGSGGWTNPTFTPVKPFVHGVVKVEDDDETGGEGSQESIYIVLSVTDPEGAVVGNDVVTRKRYFRKEGYYASYDGSNWDGDFHEVWPKTVNVTRWVSKKP